MIDIGSFLMYSALACYFFAYANEPKNTIIMIIAGVVLVISMITYPIAGMIISLCIIFLSLRHLFEKHRKTGEWLTKQNCNPTFDVILNNAGETIETRIGDGSFIPDGYQIVPGEKSYTKLNGRLLPVRKLRDK